jgi:imidazolonepropionase-like amidohydrolase
VVGNRANVIFPQRKIGALEDGYEANFLVLQGNPIQDFNAVKRIRMRVKQGDPLK